MDGGSLLSLGIAGFRGIFKVVLGWEGLARRWLFLLFKSWFPRLFCLGGSKQDKSIKESFRE